ncbi:MAG: glycoside hydrolase [Planctomycetota bacterium]
MLPLVFLALAARASAAEPVFPYIIPDEKPDIPLSAAMERAFDRYDAPTTYENELFTRFRYSRLEGLDYHGGDGTLSRRDPSKVVKADGKYYVWYTRRETTVPPRGPGKGTDTEPSTDWDLAEIWYATSEDGFTWKEQGVAVPRPPKPIPGWRSVSTPDVLVWEGKYYLYYQSYLQQSGTRGDDCPVSMSYADSPDGPWTPTNKVIIENGPPGSWDEYSIHDPYPLVRDGKIWIYYKCAMNGLDDRVPVHGLVTADDPAGPFEKCPLNPISNSGHETCYFPFRDGVAGFITTDGNEHNSIQYAPDGINFEPVANVNLTPVAAAPYIPDAFTDTKDGRGFTWGMTHFTGQGSRDARYTILARFDCDLSLDYHDRELKKTRYWFGSDTYFRVSGLSRSARKAKQAEARADLAE